MAGQRTRKRAASTGTTFPGVAELLQTIENNFRALAMMMPGTGPARRKPARRASPAAKAKRAVRKTVRKVARKVAKKARRKAAPAAKARRRNQAAVRRALRAASPL